MIILPLYIFLFIYFAFLLVFLFFAIVNTLHMMQTGGISMVSFFVTFLVFVIVCVTFFLTWFFLQGTDWQQTIKIFDNAWISNTISL